VVEGDEARLRKRGLTIREIAGKLPPRGVPVEEMGRIARGERAHRRYRDDKAGNVVSERDWHFENSRV